jgi:hypothetical protein
LETLSFGPIMFKNLPEQRAQMLELLDPEGENKLANPSNIGVHHFLDNLLEPGILVYHYFPRIKSPPWSYSNIIR